MAYMVPSSRLRRRPDRPSGVNWDTPLAQGLRALWPLCGDGRELVGGRTATAFNGALGSPRPDGMAMRFDGTNDYMAPSRLTGLPDIGGPLTMACRIWVNPAITPTSLDVFSLVKDDTGSPGSSIAIELSSAGGFWNVLASAVDLAIAASGLEFDSTNGVYAQRWHDIVLTKSAAGGLVLYSGRETLGTGTNTQAGATGVVRIGSYNATFPDPYFNGWIADALIANRVWTPADVRLWWAPETRHSLYWRPSTRVYEFFGAAAAVSSGYLLVRN